MLLILFFCFFLFLFPTQMIAKFMYLDDIRGHVNHGKFPYAVLWGQLRHDDDSSSVASIGAIKRLYKKRKCEIVAYFKSGIRIRLVMHLIRPLYG